MRQNLSLRNIGKLALTGSLRQAFWILQMPQYELGQWLLQEIETNPLLECEEISANLDPIQIEQIPEKASLFSSLQRQIGEHFSDPEQIKLAFKLLEELDERGYLSIPSQEEKQILSILKTFDPPGIFAQDLQECLLLQLPQESAVYQVVQRHFHNLIQGKWKLVARSIGWDLLHAALKTISRLNQRPADLFHQEPTAYLIADLCATQHEEEWHLEIKDDAMPKIRKRIEYWNLTPASLQEKQTLQKWKSSAQSLFRSLKRREEILFAIGAVLLQEQSGYLEQKEDLKPLTLKDIAKHLHLHESTLSRAIDGKAIQTPIGLLSLRSLLSSDPNMEKAKRSLKTLIGQEPPSHPLSDTELAEALRKQGLHLARRTVAKYRSDLQILPSSRRLHQFRIH